MDFKKLFRKLCLLTLLSALPSFALGGDLKVVVFKVDSADSSLIVFPTGKTMLIDTAGSARTADTVITFLQRHGITHLDYFMRTHEHPDHVGGVPNLQAGGFLDTATVVWDWNTFEYGDTFTLEGTDWFIYNARDTAFHGTDANYNSISYRIEYNGFVYSGTGDEGTKSMTRFMNDHPALVPAHVRNTEHHGYGPSSETFLNKLDADLYIVSCATECESYSGYKLIKKVATARGATLAHTHYTGNIYVRATSGTNWNFQYYAKTATIPGFYVQNSNTAPTVNFLAPANPTVQQGTNLYVNVSATDADGTISRVYLSKNGIPLTRSEGGAPFEWNALGQSDAELLNLQPGTFTLTAKAVDNLGAFTEKTITITVQPANLPPYFTSNPFSKPDATVGTAYSQSFSALTVDPEGSTKTFSKVSGPVWLSVTSAGTAQGTPASLDIGTNSFLVKVTDIGGLSATATMKINVIAAPALPAVGSIITLKAVNGKYVSATFSTNNALIANKTTVSNYERFKVVNATNSIALQCMGNNKFVSIDAANGSKPLVANRASIGSFEKFQLSQSGSQIAIRSVRNTNYVSAVSNGVAPLQASQIYVGSYEKFTWKVE